MKWGSGINLRRDKKDDSTVRRRLFGPVLKRNLMKAEKMKLRDEVGGG
jgi:hypothetical protein